MRLAHADATGLASPVLNLGTVETPLKGVDYCRSIILKPVTNASETPAAVLWYTKSTAATPFDPESEGFAGYGTIGIGDSKEVALRGGETLIVRTDAGNCDLIFEMNWEA